MKTSLRLNRLEKRPLHYIEAEFIAISDILNQNEKMAMVIRQDEAKLLTKKKIIDILFQTVAYIDLKRNQIIMVRSRVVYTVNEINRTVKTDLGPIYYLLKNNTELSIIDEMQLNS